MKKIISIVLSLILALSMTLTPSGLTASNAIISQTNEKIAAKYAEEFVESIYETLDLQTGKVSVFYDENDKISGYCVDFNNEGVPNGYVVIKFSANKLVVSEFCIEKNVVNPFEQVINDNNINNKDLSLYSLGVNDYQVYDKNSSLIYLTNNEILSVSKFNECKTKLKNNKIINLTKSRSSDSDLIVYSSLNGYTVISDRWTGSLIKNDSITHVYHFTYHGSKDVTRINKTYACAVVALCNLMGYNRMIGFGLIEDDFATLYTDLWNRAGTNSNGSTVGSKAISAGKDYLKSLGYKCSTNSFLLDLYSDFTKAIDADKPCILAYEADFNGKISGHMVFVTGYVETTSYKYLQVADGWNSYLRYINYNGYNYKSKDGWSFTISK